MSSYDDDEIPLEQLSVDQVAELAEGPSIYRRAPALAELARRDPERAGPVAHRALEDDDEIVRAAALRALDLVDPPSARAYMRASAATAPTRVLDAMVERLAVDAPVMPEHERELLETIAGRLRSPRTDEEHYLARLLFRRYPDLATPS